MLKRIFTGTMVLIMAMFMAVLTIGCSNNNTTNNEVRQTATGYVITPGVQCTMDMANVIFSYAITEEESAVNKVKEMTEKAEEVVRKWWGNDATFKKPIEIFPVVFYGQNAPRGFQGDGYIFIDPFGDDSLATLVHEYIHLQNEKAFVITKNNQEIGREFLEMVVEALTVKLLGIENVGIPTDNYVFFDSCPKLRDNLETFENAFKNNSDLKGLFGFGKDTERIFIILDYYKYLTEVLPPEELELFCSETLGINKDELMNIYSSLR